MKTDPRPRKLLLTVHVVTTVAVIGAALILAVLGQAALGGAKPQTIYPAAHLIESIVILPLAVVALASGIAQALLGGWGLLRNGWVVVKLVVTVALTGAVVFVLEPGLSAAAANPGAVEPGQRLVFAIAPVGAVLLGLVNVVLGMYKPVRAR